MATVAIKQERNNKSLAAILTILIHGLLLLFFILYIIITPIPPYPEPPGGAELELDFGNNINGTGNVEANNIGNNVSKDNVKQPSKTNAQPNPAVVNNNAEGAPVITGSKNDVKAPLKPDTVKPQPQISVQLAGIDSKMKSMKGQSGGNGNSGQKGNAGSPNGVLPGTNTGTGGGPGGGNGSPDFKLSGRQLVHRPNFVTNDPVQGQIVVGITVDQDGNVTEATAGVTGTQIVGGDPATLYKMVQNAAMKTKFNKSPDGTPEQYGTITFRFTIQ